MAPVNRHRLGAARPSAARVAVIGAGIGGLCAALDLASAGCEVRIFEKSQSPGGKLRVAAVGDARIDAGPTVLTMRWVFDELFDRAGVALDTRLQLRRLDILARHAWTPGERLDLHADVSESAAAVARFSGAAQARLFLAFNKHAAATYHLLEQSYLRAPAGGVLALIRAVGVRKLPGLWRMQPLRTLWGALDHYFPDQRLKQLFARYATYCGTSPFAAPATLMLIASVEQSGVWAIEGGMHRLAGLLAELIVARGGQIHYGVPVQALAVTRGRITAVRDAHGERFDVDAVIANADLESLQRGALGEIAARAVASAVRTPRSMSAFTSACEGTVDGIELSHHNVFFSSDYRREFQALDRDALPEDPTVYVCAQARTGERGETSGGPQPLFILINAPANGDRHIYTQAEIARCEARIANTLDRCGVRIGHSAAPVDQMTPTRFETRFPGTGGALYGSATNGWQASFRRPGARTLLKGLYLTGGSVHPGPGLPMVALSGRQAAMSVLADLGSTARSRREATHGGISMR